MRASETRNSLNACYEFNPFARFANIKGFTVFVSFKYITDLLHCMLYTDSYPGDVMRKIANGDHHYNARKQDAEPLGEDIAYMLWSFYKPHNQRLASLLTDDKFLWS